MFQICFRKTESNASKMLILAFGLGHPDLLERTLGLRLLAFGQLVQDIGGLGHPTTLAARPSALTTCPNSVLAALRKTSVSGSEDVSGWVSSKTVVSVTRYAS